MYFLDKLVTKSGLIIYIKSSTLIVKYIGVANLSDDFVQLFI